jgi:hypothetical protein
MTQTEFENLVKNIDLLAHQHPPKYKLRVKLLANCGEWVPKIGRSTYIFYFQIDL